MNFMEDNGNLYVFGGSSSTSEYIMQQLDANLNILATYNTGIAKSIGVGFASVVNGSLFLGSNFTNGLFDYKFDLSHSLLTSVNFDFNIDCYITNTNYVSSTDTLHISNVTDDSTYQISSASEQLLVASVPSIP